MSSAHTPNIKRQRVVQVVCSECSKDFNIAPTLTASSTECCVYDCQARVCEQCVSKKKNKISICLNTFMEISVCTCDTCMLSCFMICNDCTNGGFSLFQDARLESNSNRPLFEQFIAQQFGVDSFEAVRLLFWNASPQIHGDLNYAPSRLFADEQGNVCVEKYSSLTGARLEVNRVVDDPVSDSSDSSIDDEQDKEIEEEVSDAEENNENEMHEENEYVHDDDIAEEEDDDVENQMEQKPLTIDDLD